MTTYRCDDGNAEIEIEADSADEAAQEYVDGGSWGDVESTTWITVYVTTTCEACSNSGCCAGEDDHLAECVTCAACSGRAGDRESVTIALDPTEPECEGEEHDWRSPIALVGGIKENPGVWGHGGGVTIHEVCGNCGVHRHKDTWAQNPETGEQGLDSVRYEDADAETLAYVARRSAKRTG